MSWMNLLEILYPVGSLYFSVASESPASVVGGTWTAVENAFLMGASELHGVLETGGEEEHTLTIDEMPAHKHGLRGVNSGATSGPQYSNYPVDIDQDKKDNWNVSTMSNTGGGQAHNNLPPYLAVYIWYRTA